MTEQTPGPAPRVSDAWVAEQRRLLADKDLELNHPAHYAIIKAGYEQAILLGAYTPPPAPDPAVVRQQAYDRQWGISERAPETYAVDLPAGFTIEGAETQDAVSAARQIVGALRMSPETGAAVARDLLMTNEVDPAEIRAGYERMSLSSELPYAEACKLADAALARAAAPAKASDLSLFSLVQLAIQERHLRRAAAARK